MGIVAPLPPLEPPLEPPLLSLLEAPLLSLSEPPLDPALEPPLLSLLEPLFESSDCFGMAMGKYQRGYKVEIDIEELMAR